MDQGPALIKLAVFGQPVAQSLSPRIHRLFAEQFDLDIEYTAIEATHESFGPLVGELARGGGRGCNVTVPFKNAAWQLATVASEDANRAEAANTLVFTASDWFADNTDGGGLVDDLALNHGIELAGKRVCLLGAGGASGGVLASLLRQKPMDITVANRTLARAESLAERHADLGQVTASGLDALAEAGPFDLVINATSLGHGGEAPDLPQRLFRDGGFCYDMNYGTASRPLRSQCEALGVNYTDGLGMLVSQAARSFQIWTGRKPDTPPVLRALSAAWK